MPIPTDEIFGSPSSSTTGNYILGFWWSNADWQWWPYYLGEARESTGNPDLTVEEAKMWAETNGFNLRLSIPAGGGPPGEQGPGNPYDPDSISYDSSGRQPAGGGSGRGGGGAREYVAPNYNVPPEATIRDQAKAYAIAVSGYADENLINEMVSAYMKADRANFDAQVAADKQRTMEGVASDVVTVDAWEEAKSIVRNSSAYQTVHDLRPDSVDELEWVGSRQAKLRQLGLSAERAERLGIKQAQAGANDEALRDAGEMQFTADTGRLLRSQRESLKQSANAVLGLV